MENKLDRVEEVQLNEAVLREFYEPFKGLLEGKNHRRVEMPVERVRQVCDKARSS